VWSRSSVRCFVVRSFCIKIDATLTFPSIKSAHPPKRGRRTVPSKSNGTLFQPGRCCRHFTSLAAPSAAVCIINDCLRCCWLHIDFNLWNLLRKYDEFETARDWMEDSLRFGGDEQQTSST